MLDSKFANQYSPRTRPASETAEGLRGAPRLTRLVHRPGPHRTRPPTVRCRAPRRRSRSAQARARHGLLAVRHRRRARLRDRRHGPPPLEDRGLLSKPSQVQVGADDILVPSPVRWGRLGWGSASAPPKSTQASAPNPFALRSSGGHWALCFSRHSCQ